MNCFTIRSYGRAVLAWALAQVLKVVFVLIVDRRFDFHRLVGAGGMPSSHSSFVTSLMIMIGFHTGLWKPVVCGVFCVWSNRYV